MSHIDFIQLDAQISSEWTKDELKARWNDVTMGAMASHVNSVYIVCSAVGSDADQRKHQSSVSLPYVRGIYRWPVNSPHKRPVMRKMFPFDDIIMWGL